MCGFSRLCDRSEICTVISVEILKQFGCSLCQSLLQVLRDKNLEVVVPDGMSRRKQYIIAAACSLVLESMMDFTGPGTGPFYYLLYGNC